ncbi:MAG TPA: hypothetical protein VK892_04530 [Pyrinomonadaceae bacterium]|nr:hypothetical protein [Pyrinomonadaceae bacterium]
MLTCEQLKIPKRLHTNKKKKIPDFSKDLYLYRWIKPEHIFDGRVSTASIGQHFQPPYNISVNRSSLCEYSTDVLYNPIDLQHRFDYGVMQARVEIVNGYTFDSELGNGTKVTIKFEIEHSPIPCMYPHSEICIYKDGVLINKKISNNTLKADIRDELRELFTICHNPDPAFKPTEKTFFRRALERIWWGIQTVLSRNI